MNTAIVLLIFVIGVSIRAQEWAFPPAGMSNSVNQFDSSRNPIRQIGGMESSPSFWNMPMAAAPLNEFAQPTTVNHYGQASHQASPLYNAPPSPHQMISDSCCTSPTTVQMANNIAEVLKILRTIAASLGTLNANFANSTMSIVHHVADDMIGSSEASNAEKPVSTAETPSVAENDSTE